MGLFKPKKLISKIYCSKCGQRERVLLMVPKSDVDYIEKTYVCLECRKGE